MQFARQDHPTTSVTVLERPVLRLGLLGFDTGHADAIRRWLRERGCTGERALVDWELAEPPEADAWWVDGRSARSQGDGSVEFSAAAGASLRIFPADIGRPLAWALPLSGGISADVTFDPSCRSSMERALQRLEQALGPLTAQLCLASQLLQREAELGHRLHQVLAKGRLLAVVDLRGDTAVCPDATVRELATASWRPRPGSAAGFPEDFVRISLSMLMWQYATRTRECLLPHRYRNGPMYLRRAPRVPHRLLKDVHLLVLRQLAARPRSFEELQTQTGLGAAALAHELAALYLVGAITANPRRARTLGEALVAAGVPSVSPSGIGPLESQPFQAADSTSSRALTQ